MVVYKDRDKHFNSDLEPTSNWREKLNTVTLIAGSCVLICYLRLYHQYLTTSYLYGIFKKLKGIEKFTFSVKWQNLRILL